MKAWAGGCSVTSETESELHASPEELAFQEAKKKKNELLGRKKKITENQN